MDMDGYDYGPRNRICADHHPARTSRGRPHLGQLLAHPRVYLHRNRIGSRAVGHATRSITRRVTRIVLIVVLLIALLAELLVVLLVVLLVALLLVLIVVLLVAFS